MKKMINATSRYFYNRSLGILLLRVATGLIFLLHGWQKATMLDRTVSIFHTIGFATPVTYFIVALELVGGLALILGVATRLVAVLFGIEMVVAFLLMGLTHGLGLEFYLAAASFSLALMGSGRYSVFKMECEKCGGMLCKGKTGTCAVEG